MKTNFEEDFINDKHLQFYLKDMQLGLDIDEVLANFVGRFKTYFTVEHTSNWYFTYKMEGYMNQINQDKDFWLGILPRILPTDIPFIPKCYISKRSFPVSWTEEWIEKNKFPCVPVIHVEDSKVEACKRMKLDYFVDDNIKNFQELNKNFVKTFLMDAPHNIQYNVGPYRITQIKDILDKI